MSVLAIPREDLSGCIGFDRCYARGMNREQAVEAMMRILGEERRRPKTRYKLADTHPLLQILVPAQLNEIRKDRPRSVKEDPREFEVAGKNYELLMLLFSGVDLETKQDLVEATSKELARYAELSKLAETRGSDADYIAHWFLGQEVRRLGRFRRSRTRLSRNEGPSFRHLEGARMLMGK